MKTFILSILCLLAVSGKSQWDSVAVKNRLEMASYNLQEYSNLSRTGWVCLGLGGVSMGVSSVFRKKYKGESIGLLATGSFLLLFGTILCGSATFQIKDAGIWISPSGASFIF